MVIPRPERFLSDAPLARAVAPWRVRIADFATMRARQLGLQLLPFEWVWVHSPQAVHGGLTVGYPSGKIEVNLRDDLSEHQTLALAFHELQHVADNGLIRRGMTKAEAERRAEVFSARAMRGVDMTFSDYIELVNNPHRPVGSIGPCLIDRDSVRRPGVQARTGGLPRNCLCGGSVMTESRSHFAKCARCGAVHLDGRRATLDELRERARTWRART